MAGFDWNEFYTVFEARTNKAVPDCKVGRYIIPKESNMPYLDVSIGDNSGGSYTLDGKEGSQNPLIILTAYATGVLADSMCDTICKKTKEIMLSYGFQCIGIPIPVTNVSDPSIKRWVGRYKRIFASADELKQLY